MDNPLEGRGANVGMSYLPTQTYEQDRRQIYHVERSNTEDHFVATMVLNSDKTKVSTKYDQLIDDSVFSAECLGRLLV